MASTLYPQISIDQVEKSAHDQINKLEVKHMLEKIEQMKLQSKHYDKLRKNWQQGKTVIRYCCHATGIILEVGGIATTFYTGASIPLIISAVGILDNFSVELLAKLFDIKVNKYKNKVTIIQKYIDELYLFMKKATADNIITTEEIQDYQNILKNYEGEINKVKEDHDNGVNKIISSVPKNEELMKSIRDLTILLEKQSRKGIGT